MIIVRDTREKVGYWEFEDFEMSIKKLDTGDYSIVGLEDILCIERKKSITEFCGNITQARFTRELERMEKYPYRFLILEFDVDDVMRYPIGSSIPKWKWAQLKITGKFIMSAISNIQIKHGVNVIFAGGPDNAKVCAMNIMKRVNTKHGKKEDDS